MLFRKLGPVVVNQALFCGVQCRRDLLPSRSNKFGEILMIGDFDIRVERDSEGYYVAFVPALPGCHTQARSLDELSERIKEVIALH